MVFLLLHHIVGISSSVFNPLIAVDRANTNFILEHAMIVNLNFIGKVFSVYSAKANARENIFSYCIVGIYSCFTYFFLFYIAFN